MRKKEGTHIPFIEKANQLLPEHPGFEKFFVLLLIFSANKLEILCQKKWKAQDVEEIHCFIQEWVAWRHLQMQSFP